MYRLIIFMLLAPFILKAQPRSAQDVLDKSIRYHDPHSKWGKEVLNLQLRETRPGGTDRETHVLIDLPNERFELDQLRDGVRQFHQLENETCSYQLNGRSDLTENEIQTHRLSCDRTKSMRNYYTYLWGLPMKLRDPGTIIGEEVLDTNFNNRACWGIRVTYNPEVGKDTWYFYFDKKTYALIGYRFYHDETKNDGEYIILENEMRIGDLRLPKIRKWYTHGDEQFLGEDILVGE